MVIPAYPAFNIYSRIPKQTTTLCRDGFREKLARAEQEFGGYTQHI